MDSIRTGRRRWAPGFDLATAIACVAGVFVGCSDDEQPAGQLVISLQTNMSLPDDIDLIRLDVESFGKNRLSERFEFIPKPEILLPATIALLAGENPEEPVHITVSASQGGVQRTLREVTTTVPKNRVALLRVPIDWFCYDESNTRDGELAEAYRCGEGTTCVAGACVDQDVDSRSLPDYVPEDVFGGGSEDGDGDCFDTVACFSEGTAANVDQATCSIAGVKADTSVALVTKPGTRGICAPGYCLIPLDADSDYGWREKSGRVQMPDAVCDRLRDDDAVVGVVTTTACEQKTESLPTCGPWSSITGKRATFDAGLPDDVTFDRDGGVATGAGGGGGTAPMDGGGGGATGTGGAASGAGGLASGTGGTAGDGAAPRSDSGTAALPDGGAPDASSLDAGIGGAPGSDSGRGGAASGTGGTDPGFDSGVIGMGGALPGDSGTAATPLSPCVALANRYILPQPLIVARQGGPVVSGQLVLDPSQSVVSVLGTAAGATLDLQSDGSFTLDPTAALSGVFEAGIQLQDRQGLVDSCLRVLVVDTYMMPILMGGEWTSPTAWSTGQVPTSSDVVLVPAGAHTVGSSVTVGTLLVETGADVRMLSQATLAVQDQASVGGYVAGGDVQLNGAVVVAGQIDSVACAGQVTLGGPLLTTSLYDQGSCALDVASRLTSTDVSLGSGASLVMTLPWSTIDTVDLYMSYTLLNLTEGEIRVAGDYTADPISGAPGAAHTLRLVGSGRQNITTSTLGSAVFENSGVSAVAQFTFGTFISGNLYSARATETGGSVYATYVFLEPGFSTTNGDICYEVCDDSALPGACSQLACSQL